MSSSGGGNSVGLPVPFHVRADLEICPQSFAGRKFWVVKDPAAVEYFRLREHEYFLLRLLDGRRSLEDIKLAFERAFPPQRMTIQSLRDFVGALCRNGLLLSDAVGQGQQLFQQRQRRQRRAWLASAAGLLAIRFRGFDPDRLLDWLCPKTRFLFSCWSVLACLLLIAGALGLIGVEWARLQARLPTFEAFISSRNLLWVGLALAGTKVLHEFGHALTCKHFGGECHELGVLFLVFTPCLYCDVSDSWMLNHRWKRLAITFAGIWVEVVLAALCTFAWWFRQPGMFNSICLNVMLVCTVSALFVNGNPLLRYDGYYILSDLLDIPNLWTESRAVVRAFLARVLLGVPADRSTVQGPHYLLLLYGCASTLYRGVILVVILFTLHRALTPHGLQLLSQLITCFVVGGILLATLSQFAGVASNRQFRARFVSGRFLLTCGLLLLLGYVFFAVPIPWSLRAPVVLQARDAQTAYVVSAGHLLSAVKIGDQVVEGEPVAQLEDWQLSRAILGLRAKVERQRTHVRNLGVLRVTDVDAGRQFPAAKQLLTDLEKQLEQKLREEKNLQIIAPQSGTVMPMSDVTDAKTTTQMLQQWTGLPLDERNRGCWLARSTPFCLIGDPTKFDALLVIDHSDVRYIKQGQSVRVRLNVTPGEVLHGTVAEVGRRELQFVPQPLAANREVAHKPLRSGVNQPLRTSYQVRIALDDQDSPLLLDARGMAKVAVTAEPLSHRLYRFLIRTFRVSR